MGDQDGHAQEGEEKTAGALIVFPEQPISFMLTSLPPSLQWHIARRMGRRCRIVGRALLDAYGPVGCGLRLEGGRAGLSQLQRLLERGGPRLSQVTSLQLHGPRDREHRADLLAAVVTKLPNVASLGLCAHPAELPLLAALRRTLTALDLAMQCGDTASDRAAGVEGLVQLTNVRALTLSHAHLKGNNLGTQDVLGMFPHQDCVSGFVHSSPRWLASVRPSMPHLTSLSLGREPLLLGAWSSGDVAAVEPALAGLRSLSLDAGRVSPSAFDAMVAGMVQRTEIEFLHLGLALAYWHPTPDLLQLSRLELDSLDLCLLYPGSPLRLEPLAHALHTQRRLTRLTLECIASYQLAVPRLPSSLVELLLEGAWAPLSLPATLGALPCLRVLRLSHRMGGSPSQAWTRAAAAQLSTFTQLHTLSVTVSGMPPGWTADLSGLTALKKLRLEAVLDAGARHHVTDWDLLQLVTLQELTRLSLDKMHGVSASGLVALVEPLSKLLQLEVSNTPWSQVQSEVLVNGLLPRVLPRLTSLKLPCVQHVSGGVRNALLSAAEMHGCRCDGW